MAGTVTRVVALASAAYRSLRSLPDGTTRQVWLTAERGDEITLTPEEARRLDALDALQPVKTPAKAKTPAKVKDGEDK